MPIIRCCSHIQLDSLGEGGNHMIVGQVPKNLCHVYTKYEVYVLTTKYSDYALPTEWNPVITINTYNAATKQG